MAIPSTATTYEEDGKLILNLWIVSMIFLVAQCMLSNYAAAPPTQDRVRKLGINFNEEVNDEGEAIVRAML